MTLSNLDWVSESARQRLGWAANELPRVKTIVPAALQQLAEKEGVKRGARNYFLTDPATDLVTLGGAPGDGNGDLATLITDRGLQLDKLDYGRIKHSSSTTPLKPLGTSASRDLPSPLAAMGFLRYFVEGTIIHTISTDNNDTPLTGDLSIACPRVPAIKELNTQERDELIAVIILLAQGQPPKAVDNAV